VLSGRPGEAQEDVFEVVGLRRDDAGDKTGLHQEQVQVAALAIGGGGNDVVFGIQMGIGAPWLAPQQG
jgi:hypothetical protein